MRKSITCFEHYQASSACPSENSSINIEMNRSFGGIILTGENQSTRRKTWPSATLSTTNLTSTFCCLLLGSHETRKYVV